MTTKHSQVCAHCLSEAKCRRRDFSEQAWSVLVLWEEVDKSAADQALCDGCYDELREVLIDRSNEVEMAIAQPSAIPAAASATPSPTSVQKPAKISKLAS